jgi:cytoskeletal protein CcmA (bactofilin family)
MPRPGSSIPSSITVTGNIYASEDMTISGRIHGDVVADACAVSVMEGAHVAGSITASDVTIAGRAEGTVLATEIVEVQASAHVKGRLLTPRIILADGAQFNGTVEPERVDAAKRVQEYRRREASKAAADVG